MDVLCAIDNSSDPLRQFQIAGKPEPFMFDCPRKYPSYLILERVSTQMLPISTLKADPLTLAAVQAPLDEPENTQLSPRFYSRSDSTAK